MRTSLIGLLAALLLAGCIGYSLIPPTKTTVTGSYSVTPAVAWNKSTVDGDERWTIDGNTLQELIFISVTDGKRLMSSPLGGPTLGAARERPAAEKLPVYRSVMTLLDIKELVEASITQLGAIDLETTGFRAAKFGALDGFRFEISFARRNGLIEKGFVVGSQTKDRLHLIIFTAASVYYYDRDLPEAERIVNSIAFPKA